MIAPSLLPILRQYDLGGRPVASAALKTGHINTTHVVHVEGPAGRRRFVLQRVNRQVFKDVPALMENVSRVTAHLRRKLGRAEGVESGKSQVESNSRPPSSEISPSGFQLSTFNSQPSTLNPQPPRAGAPGTAAPTSLPIADRPSPLARPAPPLASVLSLRPTTTGQPCLQDGEGEWWRLFDFIEGAHTVDRVTSPAQAREAARAFGQFQALLADLEGPRLHETIVNFHHTPSRVAALRAALAEDPLGRAAEVRAELEFALERAPAASRLVDLQAAGVLTERVTHNDTKINNVMLDQATGRAVAVVDLDTVMPGLALYDFGDLVRASASSTAEDDPEPANMRLVVPLFQALVEGWLEAGAAPTAAERALLPFAGNLMSYETGVRFLTDYLQGDTYFKVHHANHNLHRARTQFALVRSIENQEAALQATVADLAAGLPRD